ncbi:MAG: FG-GAP repeat domain-containing protein [Acidimicrobiales bacterium]
MVAFHVLALVTLGTLSSAEAATQAAPKDNADLAPLPIPASDLTRGLNYAGLERSKACGRNGFGVAGVDRCTHGPDAMPHGTDVTADAAPVAPPDLAAKAYESEDAARKDGAFGFAAAAEGDPAPKPAAGTDPGVTVCDPSSGNGGDARQRTVVMYVRAADKADRYANFAASIRQWATDADSIYNNSAGETGGTRHIRFVHDSSCDPIVFNVVMPNAADDDTFGASIDAVQALGWNSSVRKYMMFVDANFYCGIGNVTGDVQPGPANDANSAPHYGRTDAGCWNGSTAAHEHMHNLGGVQMSAPNSSGGWHCTDESDLMCYSDEPYYPPMTSVCAAPVYTPAVRFDCRHDDYFSTNPPAGSYLAQNWNSANSLFLIGNSGRYRTDLDYEGDGRKDGAVYRPGATGTWYIRKTSSLPSNPSAFNFGTTGDVPIHGDLDGDGRADVGLFRPSTGYWYVVESTCYCYSSVQWGGPGDIPVPADYNGDGRMDYAVYRPSTGTWYFKYSNTGATASRVWGASSDVPVVMDVDGDNRFDITVWRPSNGVWFSIKSSNNSLFVRQWGASGDRPVAGDYDRDGRDDVAVWRPSNGVWYIINSLNGSVRTQQWGASGDAPRNGDYDGDGRRDTAVFRGSSNYWYIINSATGAGSSYQWGVATDISVT